MSKYLINIIGLYGKIVNTLFWTLSWTVGGCTSKIWGAGVCAKGWGLFVFDRTFCKDKLITGLLICGCCILWGRLVEF